MLVASLRLLVHGLRVERLHIWLSAYTAEIVRRATPLGFVAASKHAPGIVGLRPSRGMPEAAEIVRRLKSRVPRPVLVSERMGAIRISPHVYNTKADIDCLIDGLREAINISSRL